MGEHAIHPVAALFPEMTPEELHELAEDIRASGLAHPIVRDRNGTILDGLNRLRACELAGVEPRFEIFEGEDPIAFIVSSNLKRRHLNESQRAMVGSGWLTWRMAATGARMKQPRLVRMVGAQ